MKNAVTWFEIPVSNLDKAIHFYETVFSMKMEPFTIKEFKLAMFPATEVSGALLEETDYKGSDRSVIIYLNIPDSIEAVLERAEQQGGTIITPRTVISEDVGWSATFRDLDNNVIGLYESAPKD